jgi:DNA uptake protein ComE-like DNA-binding protein
MASVREMPVVDLNSAPESALVTLPGITPEYAKKIVAHRPYRDRDDLEKKTGLPRSVVQLLGPPAMIRSTQDLPSAKKKP